MKDLRNIDVRLVWDSIKYDIQALRDRYNLDWRPEDVYHKCLTGEVFLWLCDEGFLIVKPRQNQFTLENELFVWICVSHSKDITEYFYALNEIAKGVNCTKIVFETPRDGFKRWAKLNKIATMTTYTISVE